MGSPRTTTNGGCGRVQLQGEAHPLHAYSGMVHAAWRRRLPKRDITHKYKQTVLLQTCILKAKGEREYSQRLRLRDLPGAPHHRAAAVETQQPSGPSRPSSLADPRTPPTPPRHCSFCPKAAARTLSDPRCVRAPMLGGLDLGSGWARAWCRRAWHTSSADLTQDLGNGGVVACGTASVAVCQRSLRPCRRLRRRLTHKAVMAQVLAGCPTTRGHRSLRQT